MFFQGGGRCRQLADFLAALGFDVQADPSDDRELARFGYRARLTRTLGGFSTFAAGFAYISILTGLFQMFPLGYAAAGPAVFWTWPAVWLGQLLLALNFAELAAHYPLCGGVYQWSRQTSSALAGWLTGWVALAAGVVSLAAVALALQAVLPRITPAFQFVGSGVDPRSAARNSVVLGCGLIAVTTLINAVGIRFAARINNAGVVVELIGGAAIIGFLLANARRGPAVVLPQAGAALNSFTSIGPFLAGSLMSSYVLYGFDTAGSLAEETTDPKRKAPLAILTALIAAGVGGALLLLSGLMAADDVRSNDLSRVGGGLAVVVERALGGRWAPAGLSVVAVSIVACAIAVHTTTVRLMFAMARDGLLPASARLARVSNRSHAPTLSTLIVGGASAAILLCYLDFPQVIETITSVAIVWANLAYLMVTAPLIFRRLRGWPGSTEAHGAAPTFSLGRLGLPINMLAVLWSVIMIGNVAWPRASVFGHHPLGRWSALVGTCALVLIGVISYANRPASRILEEHRT